MKTSSSVLAMAVETRATEVGPQASDQGQRSTINETFGVEPAVVLADAGYCNEPDLLELENRGIDAHVALGREGVPGGGRPGPAPSHRMGEKLASLTQTRRAEAPDRVLGFQRYTLRGLAKVRRVGSPLNIKRMGTLC